MSRWSPRSRILVFVGLTYLLMGAAAGVLVATGGLTGSRILIPGTPITVAAVLLPTAYMFSPAVAHILTRLLTAQGWSGLGLRPRFDRGRRLLWLIALLLPAVVTVIGGGLYFLVFSDQFDPGLTTFRAQLKVGQAATGRSLPVPVGLLFALQIAAAVTVAPLINAIAAMGEEFGWRGYLMPQLMEITSTGRAVLITGAVWGIWHAPLIAMGYEYGFGYPFAPWLGILLFTVVTMALGVVFGWLAIRGGSVWPAAVGHGAFNAIAALPLLVTLGKPNLLVGPLPIGILAGIPLFAVAVGLLVRSRSLGGVGGPTRSEFGPTGPTR